MKRFLVVAAPVALVGCSGGARARRSTAGSSPSYAGLASRGGDYAFSAKDTPYADVLAEARRTQRPAFLFFWASW